jgi:hypothetical protein
MSSVASRAGAWVAVVGMPDAGALAAAEQGVVLERLALIPTPGEHWPTVVAALLDGVDLVVVQPPGPPTAAESRRLTARVRQRSAVLLPTRTWERAGTTLHAGEQQWYGLERCRGRLRARQLTVSATGRGRRARPRRVRVWLPAPDGAAIAPVTAVPPATPPGHPDPRAEGERRIHMGINAAKLGRGGCGTARADGHRTRDGAG